MKNIFYFILGMAVVILTSATTVSIMTVKPAPPKQYMVKTFTTEYGCENVGNYISQQMKKGWLLKEVEGSNQGNQYSTWVVVMEKY